MKFIKKNKLFLVAIVLLLASIIFFVYNIKADSDDNKIGISYAEMTGIKTGTSSFDSSDGLNYGDTSNLHATSGYTAGKDASEDNAIVRSFDKITYNFELQIKNKDEFNQTSSLTAYSNKKILIKATISEDASKYVSFTENGKPGQTTYTYEINNVNEINGSRITSDISMYVLGAPNGVIIDPKFEIQESTNTDSEYVVTLGKKDNSTHYYSYDALRDTNYSSAADFYNYMPTVVSSSNTLNLNLELIEGESQKATYDSKIGRYMNYVLALTTTNSLKGKVMPKDDIVLNATFSQTGHERPILTEDFVRLFNGQQVLDINGFTLDAPYSATTLISRDKYTRNPGSVTVNNLTNNTFSLKISDYGMGYTYPTAYSNGNSIPSGKSYIGTYAITLFSPRVPEDGGSNIDVTLSFASTNVTLTSGTTSLNAVSKTSSNEAYEVKDYSLVTGLYEMDETKIAETNGEGAKSRGSEIQYITEFNYLSTSSNDGLKETIKIDPIAYRFMPYTSKEDIDIEVYCGNNRCQNINADDFEYKFVAGDFNASNYTAINHTTVDSRIKSEEANVIKNGCTTVKNNLANYNSDQIMNLYGGPCISENNPVYYDNISSAATADNEEVVLTKLIVQTKNGVNLPDNSKVVIKTKLRVRNVTDITKKYQVTAIATSSDYDNKITYYSPRVVNTSSSEDSVLNPNNYNKEFDNSLFGDSLTILSFEAKQNITVTNRRKDGQMKDNFNVVDNETIHFKVSTNLKDYALNVGADDAWYIKDLVFSVFIPDTLTYIPTNNTVNPERVDLVMGGTLLQYRIPYTKPNFEIPDVYFDAILSSDLTGNGNEIVISSQVFCYNINDEVVDYLSSSASLKIYGNGINNMIITLTNDSANRVEKDSEFSYYINAYNNTDSRIEDYMILNVLPANNDERGSTFSGDYKVHLDATSLNGANVLCTTEDYKNINKDVLDTETLFTDCSDIFNEGVYKEVSAIKITNLSADANTSINPIKVTIKPSENKFSDTYKVSAVGGSRTFMPINSNELSFEVINRKISGRVYIDVDEDGVKHGNEKPLQNISVSLYKIIDELNQELVDETQTLESGVYTFENLEKGFYRVRLAYDNENYDLTLRYATEDTDKDSDAYKISEGLAEISNKHDPSKVDGIDLYNNIEANNMDMGLINRRPFSMAIKKYITRIDLNYNGITNTKLYENSSKVLLSYKNSLKASLKVYYGFEITNDSQVKGYVDNIFEDIPEGLYYDSTEPYIEGWVLVDNKLQNTSYQNQVLAPGESIYVQLVLNMPTREEAGTFLNRVSLDIRMAEEEVEPTEAGYSNGTSYAVGEYVEYAGLGWHVINSTPSGDEELVTLLLDSEYATTSGTLGSDVYKPSNIDIAVSDRLSRASSIFEDNVICDDASGLDKGSYGGTLKGGSCTSNQYVTRKIRLLTESEFNLLRRSLSDISWLVGNKNFYLQNSVNIPNDYDDHGEVIRTYVDNVRFVDANIVAVGPTKITPVNKYFRYVITINSKYIVNN